MLDGWYCRTMANQQSSSLDQNDQDQDDEQQLHQQDGGGGGLARHIVGGGCGDSGSEDESQVLTINPRIDYKGQYSNLKKKLKFLLYENEFFQDALRSSQRRLLKATRDRSFLLDRLLQYEKPEITSSESEETESSDDDSRIEQVKRRKVDSGGNNANSGTKIQPGPKRKKQPTKKSLLNQMGNIPNIMPDGHMTAEEVERHLQSRQTLMELAPERAPPTVPNEMFSNEPSLDSESNDQLIETSPSNMGEECLSVEY